MGFTEPKTATKQELDSVQGPVLLPAIGRLGPSVAIFGLLFLLLVFGLTLLLSPDRFPVRTGDGVVRLSDLQAQEQALKAKRADLLALRADLKLEERAPTLHRVQVLRDSLPPVGRILLAVEAVRYGFVSSQSDPISLPGIEYASAEKTIVLRGQVRDPRGHSVQILSSFVDELREISGVLSVAEPEYVSHAEKDGAAVSPFTLTLTLAHE